jgi:hypothetical protein
MKMSKEEKKGVKDILKKIRKGIRLKVKAPRVIRDRSRYTRKEKYKKDYREE